MILLARHGETDDNAAPGGGRVQGWLDPPLNARGRRQAAELTQVVRSVAPRALWASHLRRSRETATIVGEALGLDVGVDERLAESRRGAWEGRLISEIRRDDPERWTAWREAPATFSFPPSPTRPAESVAAHAARVEAALAAIAEGPLPALVVCHGGTIRAAVALRHPAGLAAFHALEVPNAALVELDVKPAPVPGR